VISASSACSGLMQRRARDLAHALRGWRLDQLRPAAQNQLLTHALRPALTRGDMLSQPPGQRLGVRDAALPKAGVRADLGPMALRGAAREVKRPEFRRGHVDLAREVRHRIVGDFVEPAREPSAPEQELEQDGKPEPGRAGLVAQLVELVADQREVVDDVIEAHVECHLQQPGGSCGMRVIMPALRSAGDLPTSDGRTQADVWVPHRPSVTRKRPRTICVTYNRERVM